MPDDVRHDDPMRDAMHDAMHDDGVLIVGAGLAGACAALTLSAERPVHLLDAGADLGAGASGAAAGLANPLMGRKAKASWRVREALDALEALIDRAEAHDAWLGSGLLRPTVEHTQGDVFQDAAARHPDLGVWLAEDEVAARFPDVKTHGGALMLTRGGAVDVRAFLRALVATARRRGARVTMQARVTALGETPEHAWADVEHADGTTARLTARRVLVCAGQGYGALDALAPLALRGVKGQTVRVRCPDGLPPLVPLSGRGYVVPLGGADAGGAPHADGRTLVLGSSYEHDFDTLDPTPEATAYVVQKTARMLPAVADAEVLSASAGVRVYAPSGGGGTVKRHHVRLGPLPGHARCWAFVGLGSRGLLTAPLLARALPGYLRTPSRIPPAVRTW
jgi:glycine oxidase